MYSCLEEAGWSDVSYWPASHYDPYRSEPRFQALLDRHHIVGYKSCCPWSRPAKGA